MEGFLEEVTHVYGSLGELLALVEDMFDTMRAGDCLDLESRPGKAPGGYQYQRQYSRTPFIFMNAAGMHRDLVTMVHEAGHAFHSLLCAHDPLVDLCHQLIGWRRTQFVVRVHGRG